MKIPRNYYTTIEHASAKVAHRPGAWYAVEDKSPSALHGWFRVTKTSCVGAIKIKDDCAA